MAYITAGMLLVPLCVEPLCRFSSSAQGIYGLMSNISSFTTYPNVINTIKELDIEASVRVLEKLVKELRVKNKTKTLDESLNLLKKCIVEIENELAAIHEKLVYNAQVWYFQTFRSYKFSSHTSKLRLLKMQLDNRTQMFFKILKANDELVLYVNPSGEMDMSIIGL